MVMSSYMGFNSDSNVWNYAPGYLTNWVRLKSVHKVNTTSTATINSQRDEFRTALTGIGGQKVLVGHSMGGLVSRATFVANPANVAALVTVGTPHEGTLLADNADKIITWLDNVRVRVGDAKAQFNSANRAEIDAFFTGGFATVEDFAMARFGIRCVFIVCKKT